MVPVRGGRVCVCGPLAYVGRSKNKSSSKRPKHRIFLQKSESRDRQILGNRFTSTFGNLPDLDSLKGSPNSQSSNQTW